MENTTIEDVTCDTDKHQRIWAYENNKAKKRILIYLNLSMLGSMNGFIKEIRQIIVEYVFEPIIYYPKGFTIDMPISGYHTCDWSGLAHLSREITNKIMTPDIIQLQHQTLNKNKKRHNKKLQYQH